MITFQATAGFTFDSNSVFFVSSLGFVEVGALVSKTNVAGGKVEWTFEGRVLKGGDRVTMVMSNAMKAGDSLSKGNQTMKVLDALETWYDNDRYTKMSKCICELITY